MPTIKVKVDLECFRCHAKIEKVLHRIREKGEFVIDDIEYDKKKNQVIVSGPFDADKLSDKLCCKAGCIIEEIEIVEPTKNKGKNKVDQPPPPDEKVDRPPPPDQKLDQPPPPPPPPTTKIVEVPYPLPYPYPFPAWPSVGCGCHHGHGGCRCCSCGPPPAPQYIMPCGYNIVCEEDPSYACTIM